MALRALARSEKTQLQLVTLLARHAPESACRTLVALLASEGLQSDARAATARARAAHRRSFPRARVMAELETLGVERAAAAAAVEEVYGAQGGDDASMARAAARTLRASANPDERRRMAGKLMRQGHQPQTALEACGLDEDDKTLAAAHDAPEV
jgi:regulatory protein